MGLLNTLFSNKQEKIKEEVKDNISDKDLIMIKREDNSFIQIKPRKDIVGNRVFRSMYDIKNDVIHHFPMYDISERKNIKGTLIEKNYQIYMYLNEEYLKNNEVYQQFIANVMLNSERLPKIRDIYYGYAGEVQSQIVRYYGEDYEQYIKCVNEDILNIINNEAKTGIMSISQVGLYRRNNSYRNQNVEKER